MLNLDEDLYQIASYLTDPICKAREYSYRALVVEGLNPTDSKIEILSRKCFCYLATVFFAFLALFSTLPGLALRGLVNTFKAEPYIFEEGSCKRLGEDQTFSLLSWNLCCVPGGYSISDGGVIPWEDRIDRVIEKIVSVNADVNCFYEMFDAKSAKYLKEELKKQGFNNFYTHIGPKNIGAPSGILVASKFEMQNPEFTQFPESTLVGRTKWAVKGVFSFDLTSDKNPFARIYATHLQHSEIPEFNPELASVEEIEKRRLEEEGRRKQMDLILDKIEKVKSRAVVEISTWMMRK